MTAPTGTPWIRRLACGLTLWATLGAAAAGEPADPFLGASYFQANRPVANQDGGGHNADGVVFLSDAEQREGAAIERVAYAGPPSAAAPNRPQALVAGFDAPAGPVVDLSVHQGGAHADLTGYDCRSCGDQWHLLPDGLIFRSFLAGPREPRISTKIFDNHLAGVAESETLWGGTVGGRRGIVRFGNDNPLRPTGVQLDIEGAAIVRLNLDEDRDVDASDFRFGVPLTWGDERVQYEFGYYHLSSHIGDEFLVRNPGFTRVNYVRDVIKFSVSYYATPYWRVYGQVGYAVFVAGGAEPWEFQFGAEYSKPGVTSFWGTPFLAVNAHLREELDFGGDFTAQAGWLWRGKSGSTLRAAVNYQNGDSEIYQFFDNYEEQIGVGLFYDF